MNIPKQIIAFIDTCPAKSRPALVFATYTHMSGDTVDVDSMKPSDAALWGEAFGILKPILAKRERDRLYRQRRKQRLQQPEQTQTTDNVPSRAQASAVPANSESSESSDSTPNTSRPQRYYKPGDIAPGRVVPNSRVEPELLKAIRNLCREHIRDSRSKAAKEKYVQGLISAVCGDYFSHVSYFPDSGRLILYAGKPSPERAERI